MKVNTTEFVADDVYRNYMETGNDWAEKVGAAELLESTLKSLENQLSMEARRAEGCSMAEAKSIALSCSDYRDASERAIRARTEANRARVRYDAIKALFEARRTNAATERAAMSAAA